MLKTGFKHGNTYFDNYLQKISGTNILENGTEQMMVDIWLKLQMEIVD